jgi:FkbM family methyltransferase
MNLRKSEINGLEFWYRPDYSDFKTFREVLERKTYLKRGMTIQSGEKWMDAGANVGAFSLLACSLGAKVTAYEPDPENCELIARNLSLNGFTAEIKQVALVPDETKYVRLYIGNNNNVWRNSIVKKWNEKSIAVKCLNFDAEAKLVDNAKIDIEGAEMPILETTTKTFDKMVYEWSFDVDARLPRLWSVLDAQMKNYRVETAWSTIKYHTRDYTLWQQNWFPHCVNVYCYNQTKVAI